MTFRTKLIISVILLIGLIGGGVAYKRRQTNQGKSDQKASREDPDSVSSQRKKMSRQSRALTTFTNQLRTIMEWRATQEASTPSTWRSTTQSLVSKFKQVPVDDLDEDIASAWQNMQTHFETLSTQSSPDPDLLVRGKSSAEKLNALLAAQGYATLRF